MRQCALTLPRLAPQYEIVLVNDGSTDQTETVAMAALGSDQARLRILRHEKKSGYGISVADGLRSATGEFIGFMDGDGQFHVEDLGTLAALMQTADLATGWGRGGPTPGSACSSPGFSISWCGSWDRSSGLAEPLAEITAVRTDSQGSLERLTFEFAGVSSVPAYRLSLHPTAQFHFGPSGQPITLNGTAGLTVVLDNSSLGPAVKRALPIKTALPIVREVCGF